MHDTDTVAARPGRVVFDVGNVLIRWDPRHLYRKVFADAAEMEWFLENVCDGAWNIEQDRGRTWAEAVAERVALYPRWEAQIRAFDERWHEMVPGAVEENVAVLGRLRAVGVPVYAITNFSAEKFEEARRRFAFLDDFDGVVVSARERLLKPDPAIYRVLLDRYRLDAADCVFVDDSARNVEGARAVGMHVIQYRDGMDLAGALAAFGLAAGTTTRPEPLPFRN